MIIIPSQSLDDNIVPQFHVQPLGKIRWNKSKHQSIKQVLTSIFQWSEALILNDRITAML